MRLQMRSSICSLMIMLSACAVEPQGLARHANAPTALAAASVGARESQPTLTLDLNTEEGHVNAELLYQERCATCHHAGRAPPRGQIAANTPDEILEALDTGFMAAVALFLTHEQKLVLARHLSNER